MSFKYEKQLSSYGLTAADVGTGLQDKIKKFLKIIKERDTLTAKLNTDISEQKKQAIREELEDIDINAADERLVKAVDTWYKNKDVYAERVQKMTEAREAKAKERGEEPRKPAQKPPVSPAPPPVTPAPVTPPPVQNKTEEKNAEPPVSPAPPPVTPAPVTPPPVENKAEEKNAEPPATGTEAEPEKKEGKIGFGFLIAAGIVLALTGIALRNR